MTGNWRPPEHAVYGLNGPGVVVLSGRVAALLDGAVLDKFRRDHRGRDTELDSALTSVHIAAMAWRSWNESSDRGTTLAEPAEPAEQLDTCRTDEVGVADAAELLCISTRGVRKAIAEQRLPARKTNGTWTIKRYDLMTFKSRVA